MKRLQELREQRHAITKNLLELQAKIDKEARHKTDAERADFEAKLQQRHAIDKEIGDIEKLASLEQDKKERQFLMGEGGEGTPAQKQAEMRAGQRAFQKCIISGEASLTAEERALIAPRRDGDELALPEERSVLTTSQDATNGIVGPSSFLNRYIEQMKGGLGMLGKGVTRVTTPDSNDFILPFIDDTGNTGSIIAEGNAANTTDPTTLANYTLRGFDYTSDIIKVSLKMVRNNYLAIENLLVSQATKRIQRKINADATTGNGTAKITGILNNTTLGKTAASATAVTYDELIDLKMSVNVAYHEGSGVGWMCAQASMGNVLKLKDGAGNYIFRVADIGQVDSILGAPVYLNNDMPAMTTGLKSFLFGDLSNYYLRFAGPPIVQFLRELYAANGLIGILIHQEADGRLADTTAVKHLIQA